MARDQAAFDAIGELDPAFLAAYRKLEDAPKKTGALDAKTQSFIRLAVDANATHLYVPAIRQDIAACFDAGASVEEIMEVLECAATLGIHALNIGVPILVDVHQPEPLSLHAVYMPSRHRPPKIDAVIRFLLEKFASSPWQLPHPFTSAPRRRASRRRDTS